MKAQPAVSSKSAAKGNAVVAAQGKSDKGSKSGKSNKPTAAQLAAASKIFGPPNPKPLTPEQQVAQHAADVHTSETMHDENRHQARREEDRLLAEIKDKALLFGLQQMTTLQAPVPQLAPPTAAVAPVAATIAAASAKPVTPTVATAPTPAKPATAAHVTPEAPAPRKSALREQNGMTRPNAGTVGDRIWCVIDEEAARLGRPVTIGELKANEKLKPELGVNISSIYARWRKFNGVEGRLGKVTAPAEPTATTPPATF
jgi:hypothetical protein